MYTRFALWANWLPEHISVGNFQASAIFLAMLKNTFWTQLKARYRLLSFNMQPGMYVHHCTTLNDAKLRTFFMN